MFSAQEPQMTVPSNLIPLCCKPTQQCAYPNSCSLLPALVATCCTQAQAPPPEKPSHLTLPQALKLPQPPHILTKFGALIPGTCSPGWALALPSSVLALLLGMGKARPGVPCTAGLEMLWPLHTNSLWTPLWSRAAPPPCACRLHPWIASQQSKPGKDWGCRKPYLQKNECSMKKPQPQIHLERDRISGNSCSHAPIGLEMTKPSKSMSWNNPCYEFPDFRAFRVAKFILPQQKQNFLPSNQGKEGRACSWVGGKADMQMGGWRREVHKASFRDTQIWGFLFSCELYGTRDTPGQRAQLWKFLSILLSQCLCIW